MSVEYDAIYTNLQKAKADNLRAEARYVLGTTTVPGEVAKQKARLRDLCGVTIYKGAESLVVSAANANDMVNHSGWSFMPTREFLASQAH